PELLHSTNQAQAGGRLIVDPTHVPSSFSGSARNVEPGAFYPIGPRLASCMTRPNGRFFQRNSTLQRGAAVT
ncbi:MAG TPA: hypothetical protein VHM19_07835, partial [Polyangiales bacterium]|nr:hypothetical protein [Polyangiales bacterium]